MTDRTVSRTMTIKCTTLHVSLTPELEWFVTARVASGRYQTASEVLRTTLRLLEQNILREDRRARWGANPTHDSERT